MKAELQQSLYDRNPLLIMGLGLCPAVAVTSSLKTGLVFGCTMLISLMVSNLLLSILKPIVKPPIHLIGLVFITSAIAASADIILTALFFDIRMNLGIFVPLIAVSGFLLNRGTAAASSLSPVAALGDGFVMGTGYLFALIIIGALREIAGSNSLWGISIVPGFSGVAAFALPSGGFISIGILMAWFRYRALQRHKTGHSHS